MRDEAEGWTEEGWRGREWRQWQGEGRTQRQELERLLDGGRGVEEGVTGSGGGKTVRGEGSLEGDEREGRDSSKGKGGCVGEEKKAS